MSKRRKSGSAARKRPAGGGAKTASGSSRSSSESGAKRTSGTSAGKRTSAASTKRRRFVAPPPPTRKRWPFFVLTIALFLGFAGFYQFHKTPSPTAGPRYVPPLTVPDPSTLPGMQSGAPPWGPGHDQLRARLTALGLPALGAEGTVLHIHQHLDVFVHGTAVTVPAQIGIDPGGAFISDLHTHDTSGIIHVESPTTQRFALGQFFDIWGVPLTRDCLSSLCASGQDRLRVFVDGKEATGDPRRLELFSHEEIVVAYGTDDELPDPIPSSHGFPLGE